MVLSFKGKKKKNSNEIKLKGPYPEIPVCNKMGPMRTRDLNQGLKSTTARCLAENATSRLCYHSSIIPSHLTRTMCINYPLELNWLVRVERKN